MNLEGRARKTPLTRAAVIDLAGEDGLAALATPKLAGHDPATATVVAFALAAKGEKLPATFVRTLLPEVENEHFGPLAQAADSPTSDVLVDFLRDERGTHERQAVAILLLANLGALAPLAMTRARFLARHELSKEAAIALGGAALKLGDADLVSLGQPHVTLAKKNKRAIEVLLEEQTRAPLDSLATSAVPRVTVGYTVKREGPAPGRNDTCPCGSGQKFKKCCALKAEAPRLDTAIVSAEQTRDLRPAAIAALDRTKLSDAAWLGVFRAATRFGQWSVAEAMIEESAARGLKQKPDELRLELLDRAYDKRALEVVERHLPKLSPEAAAGEALDVACLRRAPDLLDRLDEGAKAALRTEHDGADAIELAYRLLRYFPALGIMLARGALHEGRANDSQTLLEAMEDARDRLLLPPFEPWWDFYDAMIEEAIEQRQERIASKKEDALKGELRRARAASRKASSEIAKLKGQIDNLDTSLAPAKPAVAKAKVETPADLEKTRVLEDERRRLKTKVDELRRIIDEGQEERRDLRRQLTEIADREDDEGDGPEEASEPEEVEEEDEPGDGIEAPRGVLVPTFGERAAKGLTGLASADADLVLGVVAALAAGRRNAWSGIKHLTKVRSVMSARAGIHHRILFAVDERVLRVLDVFHRKDLEQAVTRLSI